MDLEKFIRTVPDFPIKGINFYDITTLLKVLLLMGTGFIITEL